MPERFANDPKQTAGEAEEHSCQNVCGGVKLVHINWWELHGRTCNELFTDVFIYFTLLRWVSEK